MKKYQVLLFDVDGTLLDFDKAEKIGIERYSPTLAYRLQRRTCRSTTI